MSSPDSHSAISSHILNNFSTTSNCSVGLCNSSINDDDYSCPSSSSSCSLYLFIVYTVLLGPIALAGIAANLVTFIVFWRDAMKTSTSFLLQSLAVIDIVLLITAFFIYTLPKLIDYTGWPARWYTDFGYALVLVYVLPVAFTTQTATVWVTILVAVNRYIAVCRPYQAARLCTVGQARWQLGIVLALCLVYNLPRFIEGRLDIIRKQSDDGQVIIAFKERYVIDEIYKYHEIYLILYQNVCYTIFLLLLPFVALSWLNFRLIRALSALRAKRALMQSSRHQQQQDSGVTLVLVVVIIVFLCCQTPPFLNQIFWNVLDAKSRCCGGFQFYFRCICNLLVVVNSAGNFVIYVEFNKRFRRVFLQLITCQAGAGGFVNIAGPGTCAAMETMSCAETARSVPAEAQPCARSAEPLIVENEQTDDYRNSIHASTILDTDSNHARSGSINETVLNGVSLAEGQISNRETPDSDIEDNQEATFLMQHKYADG